MSPPTLLPRPEVAVFIATSLDGHIARADGGLDWLMAAQAGVPAGEDFGHAAFMAGIDAIVMGRRTFETVQAFEPWPYPGKPVHVLTASASWRVPQALLDAGVQASCSREAPAQLLQRLADGGCRRVYIDGGLLIQSFLREDLVDSLTLTTVPVLLGQGTPLWGALSADLHWRLVDARPGPCGFVQSRYRRTRGPLPGASASNHAPAG